MDFAEFNRQIIAEFRANGGRVGGHFEGSPMVLLHTTGAKTGAERVHPLMARFDDGDLHVFASYAGAPNHPDWYHNLRANPDVRVEYLEETFPARAEVVTGAERDRIYGEQARDWPQFAEYQEKTTRTIPVVRLRRA